MTNVPHIPDHSPAAISEGIDAALIRAAFAKMEANEMRQFRDEIKMTAQPLPKRSETLRSLRRQMRTRSTKQFLTHHLPRAAQLAACLIGVLAIGTGVAFAASSAARQWAAGVLVGSAPVIDETDGFAGWNTYYEGFVDGVTVGDSVYLLDQNNQTIRKLESTDSEPALYQPAEAYKLRAMSLVESSGEIYMLCDEDDIHPRDTEHGQQVHLYRLRFSESGRYSMEQVFAADVPDLLGFEGNHTARFSSDSASANGMLYFLTEVQIDDPIEDGFGDEVYQANVVSCDPANGALRVLSLPDSVICSFGTRLSLFAGPENRVYLANDLYEEDFKGIVIYRQEDDGGFAKLGEYPDLSGAFGFVYRFDSDTVYYTRNGSIYAAPGGDFANPQRVGITTDDHGRGLIVGENGYMLVNEDHAKVFDFDTDISGAVELVLNGNGSFRSAIADALNAENPNVTVRVDERRDYDADYSTIPDDAPEGVDIWIVNNESLHYFRDAGYCAPLDSDLLTVTAEKLWPGTDRVIQDAAGALIAIPESYNVYSDYAYNRELLAEVGIPEEDLPDTWAGFLKLMVDLSQNPDARKYYTFMDSTGKGENPAAVCARRLYYHMLDSYGRIRTAQNLPIDFTDASFRELMDIFRQIDFNGLRYREPDSGADSDDSLILDFMDYDAFNFTDDFPFPQVTLKLTEGGPTISRITGYFALIDPNSAHKAEALRYLELITENYSDSERVNFFNEGEYAIPQEDYQCMLDAIGTVGEYTLYNYGANSTDRINAMVDAGLSYFKGSIDYDTCAQRMNELIN